MIKKIVSGGQTGVDRAALDVAIKNNIPHGGWCPKGRKAEDGVIAAGYQLTETETDVYSERTKLNVKDSDATLIIVKGAPMGGTQLTIEEAIALGKPYLVFDLASETSPEVIQAWIAKHDIKTLNIAGPRASQEEGIYEATVSVLTQALVSSPSPIVDTDLNTTTPKL